MFIDLGTRLNAPAAFAPGFTRFTFGPRYVGTDSKAAGAAALVEADRALNAGINSDGASRAYARVLAPGARVHRQGVGALVDGEALRWFETAAKGLTAKTQTAESAQSADLGYSYGKYQLSGKEPATYLRIWSRDAAGTWRVVVDAFVA